MEFHLMDLFRSTVALVAGGLIGYAFGLAQQAALRRNARRAASGELKSGWTLMPGAGARVAYLLLALVLVQLVCPLLFVGYTSWFVSGGVVVGYGFILVDQLRRKLRAETR